MNLREMIGEDRLTRGLWWGKGVNLITGCTQVSPACDNCWSLGMQERFQKEETGVVFHADRLKAFRRKKPTVFSIWNDLFHEDINEDNLDDLLFAVNHNPQHIFMVLTKRPYRMFEYLDDDPYPYQPGGIRNLWLGTTVESPEYLYRIDDLLRLKPYASKLFVSVEPMLGPLDLTSYLPGGWYCHHCRRYFPDNDGGEVCSNCDCNIDDDPQRTDCQNCGSQDWDAICSQCGNHSINGFSSFARTNVIPTEDLAPTIDWIICGSESSPNRRPTRIEWIRSLRDQCQSAGVPFFLKQMEVDGKLVKAPMLDGRQ